MAKTLSVPMCSRYISPRLKVGQVWFRVAYWDYWYHIREIDQYGNVFCDVYRPNGTSYETMVWAYKFDQGWLVFNSITIKRGPTWREASAAKRYRR